MQPIDDEIALSSVLMGEIEGALDLLEFGDQILLGDRILVVDDKAQGVAAVAAGNRTVPKRKRSVGVDESGRLLENQEIVAVAAAQGVRAAAIGDERVRAGAAVEDVGVPVELVASTSTPSPPRSVAFPEPAKSRSEPAPPSTVTSPLPA